MMKLIFLTIAFIATVSATCSDASRNCRFFPTSMCSNAIMKMRCKAKCGLCGTGACSDASKFCPMFQGKCDNPLVKSKCQNMCDACDGGSTDNGGACADEDPICSELMNECSNDDIKKTCKKTCGVC
ncbi:uncharacterized protein [Clytia hemisphaerica]